MSVAGSLKSIRRLIIIYLLYYIILYTHASLFLRYKCVCVGTVTFPAAPAFMTPRQRVIN